MSSPDFLPPNPLDVQIEPSRIAFGCYLVIHLAAILGLFQSALTLWLQLALLFAILVNCVHCCRTSLLLDPHGIVRVQTQGHDFYLTPGRGERIKAEVVGDLIVWPYLVIVQFRSKQGDFTLALLPDSVSLDAHRQARIYCSLYAAQTPKILFDNATSQGVATARIARARALAKSWWDQHRILGR